MPTAALADIHGNVHALDAVLVDPRVTAADRIVVLGDVVAGTFPPETFDRLAERGDRVRILRGNADRIVLEDDMEEARWARELLGPDRLAAIAAWPLSFALEVEGLGAVRCCHAVPNDDELTLTRITPEADFAASLEGIAPSGSRSGPVRASRAVRSGRPPSESRRPMLDRDHREVVRVPRRQPCSDR